MIFVPVNKAGNAVIHLNFSSSRHAFLVAVQQGDVIVSEGMNELVAQHVHPRIHAFDDHLVKCRGVQAGCPCRWIFPNVHGDLEGRVSVNLEDHRIEGVQRRRQRVHFGR